MSQKKEILYYVIGSIISVVYCFFAFDLWHYDFDVPICYGEGDIMFTLMTMKKMIDGFFVNTFQGAPFEALYVDFPSFGDTLNYIFLHILLLFNGNNLGNAVNIYYISLFPLTFCVSFFSMRKIGLHRLYALMGSLLYAFLPYRFLRGTSHLFLSNYTFVPLTILFCWMIFKSSDSFFCCRRNAIAICLFVILSALNGIYYAFFSCFFILLTILIKLVGEKKLSKTGIVAIVGIVIVLFLAMIPSIYYSSIYGENIEKPVRSPIETEIYGLKIIQLIKPVSGHGINILEHLITGYANSAPLVNENSTAYLGIAGVIGLVILLVIMFIPLKKNMDFELLSRLNLGAILLATIGGFGTVFAVLVTPQIRAYNRISVYIAFITIVAFCMLFSAFYEKIKRSKRIYVSIIFIVLSVFSLFEQTLFSNVQVYANTFYSDRDFVKRIEEHASDNAMIYQYPYYKFPETPPMHNMGDYSLGRGYIHSDNLRWSYGDYKGRTADLWHRALAEKPLEEQLKIIALLGFEGIYIDTYAYTDIQLAELKNTIKNNIVVDCEFPSENGRLYYYGIKKYSTSLQSQYGSSELETVQNALLTMCYYRDGFSGIEGVEHKWRWCSNTGKIIINNPNGKENMITLITDIYSGNAKESKLSVQFNDDKFNYALSNQGVHVELDLVLQPGENVLLFSTDTERVYAPNDPRELYMRFENTLISLMTEKNETIVILNQ